MQREIKVLLNTYGLFILAGGLLGPIYAIYVEGVGGDLITAGVSYGLFAISAGVLMFLCGLWEDHVKHKEKLLVLAYGLGLIGITGFLFVRSPVELFIVQIILGISEAINNPAYDAIYAEHVDHGHSASEFGFMESTAWVGEGIAAIAGGFIAALFGFKILVELMAALALFGFVISLTLILPAAGLLARFRGAT